MAEKLKAIVIKSNDRKEKDKNILLFSIEKGKVWATLKGVKEPKAKMKLAQNLFCFGEFVLESGKAGYIVTSFEVLESFREISEDIDKYFAGTALLEIINSMSFSLDAEISGMFILLLKALKVLCFGDVYPLYVLDKFLIELFKQNGFPLYTDKCSNCGTKSFEKLFIDYSTGQLECSACRNFASEELSKATYMALKILSATQFDRLKSIKLAEGSDFALLKVLVKNFEIRFDKKLKLIGIMS